MSNCQLQPSEITDIFSKLKKMECLQSVDLSANMMESDAVDEIAAMIRNNEHIQSLSLPYCVLDQKDLRIIIQAMQTVSSLQYVDFNNNILDNELASDVNLFLTKNCKLKELKFRILKLKQSGFQVLKNHMIKIKGLTAFNFYSCTFTKQNAKTLEDVIIKNCEIQALSLTNCVIPENYLQFVISRATRLKWLTVCFNQLKLKIYLMC